MFASCNTVLANRDNHGNMVSSVCDTLAVDCQPREVNIIPSCASFPGGCSSTKVRIFAHSAKPASRGYDVAAIETEIIKMSSDVLHWYLTVKVPLVMCVLSITFAGPLHPLASLVDGAQ